MALSAHPKDDAAIIDIRKETNSEMKTGPGFSMLMVLHDGDKGISIGEGLLGVFGACAIVLYYQPGQDCALDDFCMGILGRNAPTVAPYFFSYVGGADVAGMNFAMAAEVYPELREAFYDKPVSIAKRFVIVGFGSVSLVEKFLLALGTNAGPLLTGAIIAATLPGTIYGAVKLGKMEIPYLASVVNEYFSMEAEKYAHYKRQRGLFLTRARQKMVALRDAASRRELKEYKQDENPLVHLWHYEIDEDLEHLKNEQILNELWKLLVSTLGLSLSGATMTPIVTNGYNKLAWIPWSYIRIPAAGLVCLPAIYGLTKYCMGGVELGIDFLKNILRGQPVPSMLYQLRPKTTILLLLANLAIVTPFSYAVICMVWLHNVNVDNPAREPIGWASFAGIYVIHAKSLIDLFNKLFIKMSPDQRLRFYLKLENSLDEIEHRLTVDGFRRLAQSIAYNDFGIRLLDEDKPVLRAIEAPKSTPWKPPVDSPGKTKPLGCWARFTSYLSGSNPRPAVVLDRRAPGQRSASQ